MLTGRPTADVARAVDAIRDNPRILHPLPAAAGIQRDGDVQATANTTEPSAPSQVAEQPRRIRLIHVQDAGGVFGIECGTSLAVQALQIAAVSWTDTRWVQFSRSTHHRDDCSTGRLYRGSDTALVTVRPSLLQCGGSALGCEMTGSSTMTRVSNNAGSAGRADSAPPVTTRASRP